MRLRCKRATVFFLIAFHAVALEIAIATAFGAGPGLQLEAPLAGGLELLRAGHYRATVEAAQELERQFPVHPLPPLLAAEAYGGLIFCQTGHINSREIWHSAEVRSTALDEGFFASAEKALELSETLRKAPQTAAQGAFYKGLVHGVRARIYMLRTDEYKSGAEGKQMRAALLEAIQHDASLEPDAQVGLGAYNYYADVMSPLLKFIRFFLRIPGGDRQKGLQQLRAASQDATLLAPQARLELARILGLRENQPAEALRLFRMLSDDYPENAVYALSAAIEAEKSGDKPVAIRYFQRAAESAASMDDVCRDRLKPAAEEALSRLRNSNQSAGNTPQAR